jgi:hypothetical protein
VTNIRSDESHRILRQALGKESMASELDAAERAVPGSGSCLPGGSVIKSWHGRYDCHIVCIRMCDSISKKVLSAAAAAAAAAAYLVQSMCKSCGVKVNA